MAKEKQRTIGGVKFSGGPKDGERMDVCWPPPPVLRFGFPEWSRYELTGESTYEYAGDGKVLPQEIQDFVRFPYEEGTW